MWHRMSTYPATFDRTIFHIAHFRHISRLNLVARNLHDLSIKRSVYFPPQLVCFEFWLLLKIYLKKFCQLKCFDNINHFHQKITLLWFFVKNGMWNRGFLPKIGHLTRFCDLPWFVKPIKAQKICFISFQNLLKISIFRLISNKIYFLF